MADPNDPSSPLSADQAKRLARAILAGGTVLTPPHAQDRMNERSITTQDVENTLVGGVCAPAEWHEGRQEWRYRFETSRIGVVIAFDDEECLTVVTTWRTTP
jgi:hypothetical protein